MDRRHSCPSGENVIRGEIMSTRDDEGHGDDKRNEIGDNVEGSMRALESYRI